MSIMSFEKPTVSLEKQTMLDLLGKPTMSLERPTMSLERDDSDVQKFCISGLSHFADHVA